MDVPYIDTIIVRSILCRLVVYSHVGNACMMYYFTKRDVLRL